MADAFPKITRFFSEVGVHVFHIKPYVYRDIRWFRCKLGVEKEKATNPLTSSHMEADETRERKSEHGRTIER